jgi:betaine-aldehyde dehydrogenase
VEAFVEGTKRMKVGDPSDPATEVGPLVTFSHRKRVVDYIEAGRAEGATLVCGGDAPSDLELAKGAYLMPAVFDGATSDMRIVREEIFGPVVAVIPFDTDEEAVGLANATPYGLSGSVWTRDIARAIKVAKAVQTGVVSVNCNNSVHIEAPFGGYKMSGLGRDLGLDAIREYTEVKNVYVDLRDAE